MVMKIVLDRDYIDIYINDETMVLISKLSHNQRAEFRQAVSEGITKTVKDILDKSQCKEL